MVISEETGAGSSFCELCLRRAPLICRDFPVANPEKRHEGLRWKRHSKRPLCRVPSSKHASGFLRCRVQLQRRLFAGALHPSFVNVVILVLFTLWLNSFDMHPRFFSFLSFIDSAADAVKCDLRKKSKHEKEGASLALCNMKLVGVISRSKK